MRALITGATGLIGARLLAALDGDAIVLSRDPQRAADKLRAARFAAWDGRASLDPSLFEGVDVVYHLAGEPVAEGRWSADKKRRIEESRVLGTRAVVEAIGRAKNKPRALVSASAVGYYGSRGDEELDEESPLGEGFLPEVCAAWEEEAHAAQQVHGVRTASVRIGIVLAREGGALAKMLPLFKLGVAGKLGSGAQWMPWVHVDDVVGLLLHAGAEGGPSGPINGVSPRPVTNADFTRELARALGRPAFLPAPRAALRLAMGELAEVVLASQRVLPRVALASGYRFAYPTLRDALVDLVGHARASSPAEAHP